MPEAPHGGQPDRAGRPRRARVAHGLLDEPTLAEAHGCYADPYYLDVARTTAIATGVRPGQN